MLLILAIALIGALALLVMSYIREAGRFGR